MKTDRKYFFKKLQSFALYLIMSYIIIISIFQTLEQHLDVCENGVQTN